MNKRTIVATAVLLSLVLVGCTPRGATPGASGAPVPPAVGGPADDDPLVPDDRGGIKPEPRGPGWKVGEVGAGDKVVTSGAWVFNRSGDPVHARVTMIFNAVVQGDGTRVEVTGNQSWDSEVDSGYRWPTAIRAGFPYPIVFDVSVTYLGGRPGDKVGCSIVEGGGLLQNDLVEVIGRAPATAHCFVTVLPPPPV